MNQAREKNTTVVSGSSNLEVLCHQIIALHHQVAASTGPILVTVDRLDRLVAGAPPETLSWVMDRLGALAITLTQHSPASGLVITCGPGTAVAQAVARWSATTCLLRHRVADQWALAGGPPALHDPGAVPGRGVLGTLALQWGVWPGSATPQPAEQPVLPVRPDGSLVVYGGGGWSEPSPDWLTVSDAEEAWQRLRQASEQGPGIVFTGVSPQQMRQLAGPGADYPPVVATSPYGWLIHPGGIGLVLVEGSPRS
jgi:hypothetical protein